MKYVNFVCHTIYTGNDMDGYEDVGTTLTLTRTIEERNRLAEMIEDDLSSLNGGHLPGAVGSVGGELVSKYMSIFKFWDGESDPCLVQKLPTHDPLF